MEVDADDDVLRLLASGGQMDYTQWPDLLSRIIPRLDKIVNEDFPKVNISPPPAVPASQQTTQDLTPTPSQSSSSSANKENAPPTTNSTTFPPQIIVLITSITSTLKTLFSTHPPHTIQRLAELILNPRQHYRTLPSYLHALDRVVHVSSGAHVFPLPPAIPDPNAAATVLSNGKLASGADPLSISWGNPAVGGGLGSDESLGGALLTPISWLTKPSSANGTHSPLEGEVKTESTEMVDGPNGPGGVETVSVSVNGVSSPRDPRDTTPGSDTSMSSLRAEGGVTQGELLRQEQRAGVVPASQLAHHGEDDDEIPHARGPEEVGMEDLGPQEGSSITARGGPGLAMQGIDVEAAVGRKIESQPSEERPDADVSEGEGDGDEQKTPKREAEEEKSGDDKRVKEGGGGDEAADEDVVLADVDGKTEDEQKVDEAGENKDGDAVDTSTVS